MGHSYLYVSEVKRSLSTCEVKVCASYWGSCRCTCEKSVKDFGNLCRIPVPQCTRSESAGEVLGFLDKPLIVSCVNSHFIPVKGCGCSCCYDADIGKIST